MSSSRIRKVFEVFPKLGPHLHKGDCGKIAVVGGAPEYTLQIELFPNLAPYFASLAPMKIGADLSYVFCHPTAAVVIKSYSPELIVHPGQELERIETVINRIDSLIIGPGLGRESDRLVPLIKELLKRVKQDPKLGVVIDADGLYLIADCLDELRNCARVILTPNFREFKRLYKHVFPGKEIEGDIKEDDVRTLASHLGVNIFCKGDTDIITDGQQEPGTDRRCGGQGDLLSGAIALFIYWEKLRAKSDTLEPSHILQGALCASDFIRFTASYTFQKIGRSMNAADILEHIRYVVQEYDRPVKSSI